MTEALSSPSPFPEGGRRLLVLAVYDPRGDVSDYVVHALSALRPHCDRILVVANGTPTPRGAQILADLADDVLVRENTGFDIEAHRAAMTHLGDSIAEFDEVVFANDTWYAPVRPFGPVFARMDERALDFWGMTEHPQEVPNPFTGTGIMPRHLQSFWIAVRRRMLASAQWREYWARLEPIQTYNDAVTRHEILFTEHFTMRGFAAEAAFPAQDYPSPHAALMHADLLLRDGCPLVKRRALFHYPTFLARHAVIGRDLLRDMVGYGYPADAVYSDLVRVVAPRTLNADLGLFDIVPDAPPAVSGGGVTLVLRGVRAAHVVSVAPWVQRLPHDVAVTVLLAPGEDAAGVESAGGVLFDRVVRYRPTAVGEHPLAGADDLLSDEDVTLVVCVDAAIWDGDDNERRLLRRTQLEPMIGGRLPLAAVRTLFAREPTLGLVIPAPPQAGTLPPAIRWPANRGRVLDATRRWGIRVPVDEFGPLGPVGGVWAARPAALRVFLTPPASRDDEGESVTDLLLPYAAGEAGFHTRVVATRSDAAWSHGVAEYTLDRLLETTKGASRMEQIQFLQRAQWRGDVSPTALVKMHMRTNHPDGTHPALPLVRAARRGVERARSALRAVRRRGRA